MTTPQGIDRPVADTPVPAAFGTKLEVLLLPISDVHRAADFYRQAEPA